MEISRFEAQIKLEKGERVVVKPVAGYNQHPANHQKIMVVLPDHYKSENDNDFVGKVLTNN